MDITTPFSKKRTYSLIAIMLLSLAGMYFGIILTQFHYALLERQDNPSAELLPCTLSDSFNCDLVNSSSYSELFGIPVAFLGFLFYLFLFLSCIVCFWKKKYATKILVVLHVIVIVGILFSAYLFYVAYFIIGAICPYCIIMDSITIALLILTKVAAEKKYGEFLSVFSKFSPVF